MRIVLFIWLISSVWCLAAQELDTLHLEEVAIDESVFNRFSSGYQVKALKISEEESLEELLWRESSIYFKNYGNGQLSSIAFRGTSAYHTNVLWHGIPSNYPTLGQMDFSQWPVWMMQSITLQPGSAGALYGSGSIGGTVLLDSDVSRGESGNSLHARVEAGSFGQHFFGLKSTYGAHAWSGNTNVFRGGIDNDFHYSYQGTEHKQQHASVSNTGVQQRLKYQFKDHVLLLDGMFTRNEREIQPSKGSPETRSTLDTDNIRLAFVHNMEKENSGLDNTVSYMVNSTFFSDSLRTTSRQLSFLSSYRKEFGSKYSSRIGTNINVFRANSSNYAGSVNDAQAAGFVSFEARLTQWWKSSLNLRQSFYKGNSPFTPSLGTEFRLYKTENTEIKTTGQLGSGFRYPSLNELHWRPGGNPNLKPEKSWNVEAGLSAIQKFESFTINISASGYLIHSKDWIYWIPVQASSSPENLRDVDIRGLEFNAGLATNGGLIKHRFKLSYSLNQSLNQTGSDKGNQMIYVPLHNGNLSWQLRYKNWDGNLSAQYTGQRYATLDNASRWILDDFSLVDVAINRAIDLKSMELKIGFRVRNVLNESYETLQSIAMPGRNYQMNLSIKL